MTAGELRKALEGVPDDVPVLHRDECWLVDVEFATCRNVRTVRECGAVRVEPTKSGGKPAFIID